MYILMKISPSLFEDMIKELRSEKLQLQQQVVNLKEMLKLQAEKEQTRLQQVKPGKITYHLNNRMLNASTRRN